VYVRQDSLKAMFRNVVYFILVISNNKEMQVLTHEDGSQYANNPGIQTAKRLLHYYNPDQIVKDI
jgi:hypothetical protein